MEISVVVPVYNGEESLIELNKRIVDILEENFEIIYVDDFSKDDSRDVIKKLSNDYNQVKYIFMDSNYGQQAAIFAGLKKSIDEVNEIKVQLEKTEKSLLSVKEKDSAISDLQNRISEISNFKSLVTLACSFFHLAISFSCHVANGSFNNWSTIKLSP